MARVEILNQGAAPEPAGDPIALSRQLLGEANGAQQPEQCARLDRLALRLQSVAPQRIEGDQARIAFWVNLYHALLLGRLCRKPVRGSLLKHLRLFDRVAYEVGGSPYTLNLIEHGVLRRNRRPPLRLRRRLRDSDPRLAAVPSRLDPRIHFALNCGARSCPPIRDYDPSRLDAQLELATREYLGAETEVDRERGRVTLPRLMRLYRSDFGGRETQLEFAARRLPEVADCVRDSGRGIRVRYGRFDWTVAGEHG